MGPGSPGWSPRARCCRAGREPLVLEADDRVGGRILTEEPMPGRLPRARGPVDRRHPPPDGGARRRARHRALPAVRGRRHVVRVRRPDPARRRLPRGARARTSQHVERVLRELDAMAATVDVAAPWLAPKADEWDRISVGQWYDAQGLSPLGRELLEICTVGILAVPDRRGLAARAARQRRHLRRHRRPAQRVRGRRADQALRRRHRPDPAADRRRAGGAGGPGVARADHRRRPATS